MNLVKAKQEDAKEIFDIVQKTIRTIYPLHYPSGVVDFFCALHNQEAISSDITEGNLMALYVDGKIVGIGCAKGNHITRVYVRPDLHGMGYGSIILNGLEEMISESFDTAQLDASIPALLFYEHRGYKTSHHEKLVCEGGCILVYDVMEKRLDEQIAHK